MVARAITCRKCGQSVDQYEDGYCKTCFESLSPDPLKQMLGEIRELASKYKLKPGELLGALILIELRNIHWHLDKMEAEREPE